MGRPYNAKLFVCGFGSCPKTDCPVLVSTIHRAADDKRKLGGIRKRFCSLAHAVCWLMREIEVKRDPRDSVRLASEGIIRITA